MTTKNIAITVNKSGREIAYVWVIGFGPCWQRIGLDAAKLMLSTGNATQVPYRKN